MSKSNLSTSALAWTSLVLGLICLFLLILVAVLLSLSTSSSKPNEFGEVALWLTFILAAIGLAGILSGMLGVAQISVGARRGWPQTIPGIFLGLLNFMLGLAVLMFPPLIY